MNLTLRTACRLLLGVVFVCAGAMKIVHPAAFFSDLLGYGVPFPDLLLRLVALVLPWLEVLAGAGLLFNLWLETLRPVVALLCLVFVLMLGQAVARGLDLSCGCFGTGGFGWFERPDVALVRACLLFGASVYIMLPFAAAAHGAETGSASM